MKETDWKEIVPTDREVILRHPETTTVESFTVEETLILMRRFADLCVSKKLIDMGYKDRINGDPESELAEMEMKMAEWENLC